MMALRFLVQRAWIDYVDGVPRLRVGTRDLANDLFLNFGGVIADFTYLTNHNGFHIYEASAWRLPENSK